VLQEEINKIVDEIARQREEVKRLINDNAAKGEELNKIYVKRGEIEKKMGLKKKDLQKEDLVEVNNGAEEK